MARRLFRGRAFSENGWPYVDQGSCTWIRVPGAEHVSLQIQNGAPLQILRAFAADYHAYVEPLRDADSACWTPDNSVATSNHPGGTSMDLNWEGPNRSAFRLGISKERAFPGGMARALDELYDFYEGIMFCGGEWSIRDWMHHQLRAGTYDQKNDRPTDKVNDFIRRKIRADGFSTYKRSGAPGPPPPPPPPPPAVNVIDVLRRATGVSDAKAREILVGVQNGLRDSQCTNVNRIAMWLAQIGHESAGFNATEEYQSGDESTDRWKYKGRTWIQITWKSNYAGLSEWAHGKGIVPTPTYFVDHPKRLAEIQYAGLGPAWYWTVARPQINSLCDRRDLYAVTQAINGGQNGAADRKRRYDLALSLGDQLLALISGAPTTPGDDMAQVPQEQWDRVYRELTQRHPSRSPLRHLGEGAVDTMAGFTLNADGHGHFERVKTLASLGHPESLDLLREVASAKGNPKYPDRQDDALVAEAILAEIYSTPAPKTEQVGPTAPAAQVYAPSAAEVASAVVAALPAQEVVYAPSKEPAVQGGSTGAAIGRLYDAIEELRLADALPIESRAPLAALISVLQTKNGSDL